MLSHDRYVYLVIGDSYLIVEHALHGDVTDGAGWRRCRRRRLAAARPLLSLDDLRRPLAKERLQLFDVLRLLLRRFTSKKTMAHVYENLQLDRVIMQW